MLLAERLHSFAVVAVGAQQQALAASSFICLSFAYRVAILSLNGLPGSRELRPYTGCRLLFVSLSGVESCWLQDRPLRGFCCPHLYRMYVAACRV